MRLLTYNIILWSHGYQNGFLGVDGHMRVSNSNVLDHKYFDVFKHLTQYKCKCLIFMFICMHIDFLKLTYL